MKRSIALLAAVVLCVCSIVPVFATDATQTAAEPSATAGTTAAQSTVTTDAPETEKTTAIPAENATTEAPTTTEPPTTEPPTTTQPPTTVPPTTEAPKILYYGDINKDFRVTSADARAVLRFSARLISFTNEQCVLADVNKNGKVNSADARSVLRLSARIEKKTVFDKKVSNPGKTVTSYGTAQYQPTLKGFTTNIDDPDLFPKIKELENYCRNFTSTASFYYTDVKGKYYISFNSTRVYRTQCTIKAPFCKAALVYMEKNNIPLDTKLTLTASAKWRGHRLSGYANGTQFTIGNLIRYALTYSDNTAYQMLFNYFGNKVFNNDAASVGASLRLGSYIFGETSSQDMAKLYRGIYNYNGKFKDHLRWQMNRDNEENTGTNLICGGIPSSVTALHKWGNGGKSTKGFHDCAIVLTKTPFVLCMYTSFNLDRNGDRLPFRKIGGMCYNICIATDYE